MVYLSSKKVQQR